jgi:uncharacterized membrane protein HdeD (DUF308 family)
MTTETTSSDSRQNSSTQVMFWVTLARGILAITLGVALLIQPNKVRPFLITSMGMFWLAGGVMSIRWGVSGKQTRGLPLLAGVVGVLAGLMAISRRFLQLDNFVSEILIITILGVAILLTGVMHLIGGFRTGEGASRQWSWMSFILGLFEFVLGLALIIEPLDQGLVIYFGASIWAMLGGIILFGDALRLRSRARGAALSKDDT